MGLPLGVEYKFFDTGREVTEHCGKHGQGNGKWSKGGSATACYLPTQKHVAIINPDKVGRKYWDELAEHENAHPWGLYHPDRGRDWTPWAGSIAENMAKSREGALRFLENPPKATGYAQGGLVNEQPLSPLQGRMQRADEDITEALSLGAPKPQAPPPAPMGPPPAALRPQPPPMPQGALARPPMAPQQAPRPPSPLQATNSFRSPPVEAVLQGPRGMEAQQPRPFARGGFVVRMP